MPLRRSRCLHSGCRLGTRCKSSLTRLKFRRTRTKLGALPLECQHQLSYLAGSGSRTHCQLRNRSHLGKSLWRRELGTWSRLGSGCNTGGSRHPHRSPPGRGWAWQRPLGTRSRLGSQCSRWHLDRQTDRLSTPRSNPWACKRSDRQQTHTRLGSCKGPDR